MLYGSHIFEKKEGEHGGRKIILEKFKIFSEKVSQIGGLERYIG